MRDRAATAVETVSLSGSEPIDALISRVRWDDDGSAPTTLTFSFAGAGSRWLAGYGAETTSWRPLTDAQKEAVRSALDAWARVADLRFVEVAESSNSVGELRFARTGALSTAAGYLPDDSVRGGDVWLGLSRFGDSEAAAPGSYQFVTIIHEIGHALGLKHPHEIEGSPVVRTPSEDWLGSSIMSYRAYPGAPIDHGLGGSYHPTTPMADDIAAIRWLYGANTSAGAGDDTYAWAPGDRLFETLVDLGGIDTLDWSARSDSASIDLRPGRVSDLGRNYTIREADGDIFQWSGTLGIATDTTIENAIGGSADDRIRGNGAANDLRGGRGADRMWGENGNDQLRGEDGSDELYGGAGNDLLSGGNGGDRLSGNAGADRLRGNAGSDRLFGGDGADILDGGPGTDTVELPEERSHYTVTRDGADVEVVGRDGTGAEVTDRLVAVEWIRFVDGSLRIADLPV